MSGEVESATRAASAESADSPLASRLLPGLLSVIAGSLDVIGFFGLGGLFMAHITGNLVVLVAHVAAGGVARPSQMLSVPVFMGAVGVTKLVARYLEAIRIDTLWPLLSLQFLLLLSVFVTYAVVGSPMHPDAPMGIVAGMLGVSAMAVQSTLTQVSAGGVPATIMMTGNAAHLMLDAVTLFFPRNPRELADARDRMRHTGPVIVGFVSGCCLGAMCEAAVGFWSLALPTGLALWLLIAIPQVRARAVDLR